jgi:hypothetical protein
MDARILGVMAVPAFLVGPGRAEFDHPLTARGVPAPAGRPRLGEPPRAGQVLDHERDLLVVYVLGAGEPARLHAAQLERAAPARVGPNASGPAPSVGRPSPASWARSSAPQ